MSSSDTFANRHGSNNGTTSSSAWQYMRQSMRATGGSRSRPSLSIQNIEAMGSVYWTEIQDVEAAVPKQQDNDLESQIQANTADNTQSRTTTSHFESSTDFVHETKLFLELAGVTSLMYLGFAMSPLITASYVGRLFGPVYLSAFSLANLMGNLCTQTLVTGLFGAIDTLSPQALGKGDFAEVGYLAVRGFFSSVAILIPINVILIYKLEDILIALGEDHVAAYHANQWYNIFVWSLPFSILYQSMCKFLTVQRIMKPVIVVSIASTALIAPTLKVCASSKMGFLGTAVAYVLFWVMQSMSLLVYVCVKQPHDERTWPVQHEGHGRLVIIIINSLEPTKLREFVSLGLGGIMAQCEWVFWEALGLIVGKLGIVAMTVHTIPNQIVMNVSTVPISFGVALAVRMGISLPSSVRRTQHIAVVVTLISLALFGVVSILLYVYRTFFIEIFVDPNSGADGREVFDLAELIWSKVSFYNLNIALFGILAGISNGLGKQWDLGMINVFFLWVFGMPIIYYTTIIKENGGLQDAWLWMNIAYIGINGTLIVVFCTADWYKIQEKILSRSSSSNGDGGDGNKNETRDFSMQLTTNETTSLLNIPKVLC